VLDIPKMRVLIARNDSINPWEFARSLWKRTQ